MAHTDPSYQLVYRRKTVSWSGQLVGELKQCVQACRVLFTFVMFYLCFDQMQNNLVSQAGQMETNGTPNNVLPAMNQVGCIVLGPIIQELLYPFLHRRRIYLAPMTRITVGFAFVTLSMLYTTIVQPLIYTSPPCYDQRGSCGPSNINVWVQTPLYFLIAAGEIFAYVTALEYAHDSSPESMKVFVQAVGLLVGGVGSACAMALTPVARDPHLVVIYASLTGGMAVTIIVFWLVFRCGDRRHMLSHLRNIVSLNAAAPRTSRQVLCHPVYRVPETAPVLLPIDAGGPIVLPSRRSSRSSRLFHASSQDIAKTPTLPRRSSRRPRCTNFDLTTCSEHRGACTATMNEDEDLHSSPAHQPQPWTQQQGGTDQEASPEPSLVA
ncbi:hypothetical protein HBH98_247200 [Parastagonospora nodorum]|nr:hypothetical protein HBH53_251170 [Parastagonospora nodorum]KAH3956135.1 hypothetical protein HBH51_251820 [Parastagonospora nodorum]KAH4215399.1 hypothetical protein HBI06_253360 [Parastagonospora nodorum]KAH4223085.1 hypothetical protein HBI05_249100 [Parastagonospora nodorum]KAH4333549.1 hypothetical protein HBH98_247200 [Parastagonospora nodorum]